MQPFLCLEMLIATVVAWVGVWGLVDEVVELVQTCFHKRKSAFAIKFCDLDHVLCCLDLVTRYVFHVSVLYNSTSPCTR